MSDSATRAERLPYHGPCFICGPDNPEGLGLDWYATDGRIHSVTTSTIVGLVAASCSRPSATT